VTHWFVCLGIRICVSDRIPPVMHTDTDTDTNPYTNTDTDTDTGTLT